MVLVLPIYEKEDDGFLYNTAAVIDANGSYLGKYRKTHIPDGPGYQEKYYFSPGDTGWCGEEKEIIERAEEEKQS